jgi:hypothetical protein
MGESGSANWLKRIVLGLGLLIILAICILLAANYYFRKLGREHLRSAVAEADELDPGWRWEDLEKNRAAVPDAENAALRVVAAHGLLPKDWFGLPALERGSPQPITIPLAGETAAAAFFVLGFPF